MANEVSVGQSVEDQKSVLKICEDLKSNKENFTDLEIDGELLQLDATALSLLFESLKENRTISRLGFSSVTFSSSLVQELVNVLKTMRHVNEILFEEVDDTNACLPELLAVALMYNKSISSLTMRGCWTESPLSSFSVSTLMNSAHSLSEFHFSHNRIDCHCAAALAMAFKRNKSLKVLDLTGSSMECDAIQQLCYGLSENRCIQSLVLDFNAFQEEGVRALSRMLKVNQGITELHLFGNNISPKGAMAVADALAVNTVLSSLILSFNRIGNKGLAAISDALTVNTSLRKIWLPSNGIGCEGVKYMARKLRDMRGLKSLHVGLLLDECSVDDIAGELKYNNSLEELHFEQPCFLEEEEPALSSSLIEFYLRMNRKGRQHIRCKKIPPSLWPYILAKKAERSSEAETPDILFFLLRENPEVLDQRGAWARTRTSP